MEWYLQCLNLRSMVSVTLYQLHGPPVSTFSAPHCCHPDPYRIRILVSLQPVFWPHPVPIQQMLRSNPLRPGRPQQNIARISRDLQVHVTGCGLGVERQLSGYNKLLPPCLSERPQQEYRQENRETTGRIRSKEGDRQEAKGRQRGAERERWRGRNRGTLRNPSLARKSIKSCRGLLHVFHSTPRDFISTSCKKTTTSRSAFRERKGFYYRKYV